MPGSLGNITGGIVRGFIAAGALTVVSVLSRALQKKPTSSGRDGWGNLVSVRQSDAPRQIIYGAQRVSVIYTLIHAAGTNKEYLYLVGTASGHEVNAITKVFFDGVEVPLDGSGNATGNFAGLVTVQKNLGTSGQTAFSLLTTDIPSVWTANHRQRGCAGVAIRLKWSAEKFPGGMPNITLEVQGKKLYDPRTGLTTHSDNPALVVSDFICSEWGFNAVYANEINEPLLIAAANICDELISLAAGGNEKRYTCNGAFLWSEDPYTVLPQLAGSMASECVQAFGGKYDIYAGAYITPVLSLSETDLRGPMAVQTRVRKQELANGIKGTFVSPLNSYQPSDFPPVVSATYLTEDGNERLWRELELRYTNSVTMAQRLAKIELEKIRRQVSVTLPYKFGAYQLKPPETFYLNHARFGWTNEVFKVTDLDLGMNDDLWIGIGIIARKTDANVYAWSSSEEGAVTTPATTTLPSPSTVAAPTSMSLTSGSGTVLTRTDGVKISRIKASWTAPADEFVTSGGAIQVQYKKNADSTWIDFGTVKGDKAEVFIDGVDDGVSYDVRVRAINVSQAQSAWLTVTAHTVTGVAANFTGDVSGLPAARVPNVIIDIAGNGRLRGTRFTTANPGQKGASVVVTAGGTGVDGGSTYIAVGTKTINVGDNIDAMTYTVTVANALGTGGVVELTTGNNVKVSIGSASAERNGNGSVTVSGLIAAGATGEQTLTLWVKTKNGANESVNGSVSTDQMTPFASGVVA